MTPLRNVLLFAATLLLSSAAFAAPPQYNNGYGQQGQTVTCSSDDGGRHYCNLDTRGGVQLSRQISGTACVQGQTWGYDMQRVWVDRGCRAEFTSGRYGYGQGQGQGQTLTCSSDDGNRHYCNANTSGGVQLTRQISGTACVQGQTWGYDAQRVWVDRGCRAEFMVSGYGQGYGQGQGQGQGQIISCSSDDGKRHYCGGALRGWVQLSRQISGTPCVEGQTWGHDRRGIWVDRGCRADFVVNTFIRGNGRSQTFTCSSDDGNRHYCSADTRRGAQLTRQISGTACVQGQTWGYDSQGVWVDRGCRAEFRTR